MFDQKRYDKMCLKFGKPKVASYLEAYDAWAIDKPQKARAHHNKVACIQGWMRRDGVQPLPGYGVPKRPAAPTVCDNTTQLQYTDGEYSRSLQVCGGKVKSTHDEALCMSCGKQWRLLNDLWVEVADEISS